MKEDTSEETQDSFQHDRKQLTKAMRWKIADWLAEDRLPTINKYVEIAHPRETIYSKYIKRLIDIVVSAIILIVTSWINLIILIVTFFDVGRPVLFKQKRTGRDGETFTIIKFRNMTNERDANGELLPANQRVTKWGKFVRKTSLDELLNFWSIFKGDMSLIGPRPLPPEYIGRYNIRHRERLSVRPGLECPPHNKIHGLWTWTDQLENDIWYVEHISFKTDCMMAVRLVQYALDRNNSTARSTADRGTFMGYDWDGSVLKVEDVPQEYVERAFREIPPDRKV